MSSPAKTVSEKNLKQMEEWIWTYTRDPDGAFSHHAFCVWCLTPVGRHEGLLAQVKSLLSEPHIPEHERADQLQRFRDECGGLLDLCGETRALLLFHTARMFQHRPSVAEDCV